MIPGHATAEGTRRFAARFPQYEAAGFYRDAAGLTVSSLGLGTYLGAADEATDQAYTEAARAALRGGINFLDTAINYRHQRSERALRPALEQAPRDEVVVSTKAGFLTPGALDRGLLQPGDVAGGVHAMAPDFLEDQVERSRANLGLEIIDIFYLHNPETQLGFVSREEFEQRLLAAFERLEQLAAEGRIWHYGTATWGGYRQRRGARDRLELARVVELARQAGGRNHRFRFIQLPFNLAMPEAHTLGVLQEADRLGIHVVASASLLQARLIQAIPEEAASRFPGLETNAQRAIQFTRSAPGITVALAGMSSAAHVVENLGVAAAPPLDREEYLAFYGS